MAASISIALIPFLKTQHHEASFPFTSTKFPAPRSISLSTRKSSVKYKDFAFPEEEEPLHKKTLADHWLDIQGERDWAGLLDPMDPLLRSELIRYGEMAQACYEAFDFDPFSEYCGSCKYPPHEFFNSVDMSHLGYTVTRYLYTTANINFPNFFRISRWPRRWSKHANWIGYVAVSDDATSNRLGRRDITVAWRGTATQLEWISDLVNSLVPISSKNIATVDDEVKVESGYLQLYTKKNDTCVFSKYSARERVLTEVKRLVEMYSGENLSISVTSHSLGSALAILSAYDIAETGLNKREKGRVGVTAFSFSGPRVGNVRFKERLEELGVKVLRVVNVHDVVPKVPGVLLNETAWTVVRNVAVDLPWSYSHVGVELALDHKNSPFLNPDVDAICAHNLEAHLHLLDGYQGKGKDFVLAIGRDPSLVNKSCDFLKDHFMVPPYWRQDKNKGMIRVSGRWVQPKLLDVVAALRLFEEAQVHPLNLGHL